MKKLCRCRGPSRRALFIESTHEEASKLAGSGELRCILHPVQFVYLHIKFILEPPKKVSRGKQFPSEFGQHFHRRLRAMHISGRNWKIAVGRSEICSLSQRPDFVGMISASQAETVSSEPLSFLCVTMAH